jgi:hypothetical protein
MYYKKITISPFIQGDYMLKIRVRYMDLEPVNYWPEDAPDFDEIQKEVLLNVRRLPNVNQILSIRRSRKTQKVIVQKIITSNTQRDDGLSAFVQAKIT